MAKGKKITRPRNFFLNEQHELERGEKEQGGGMPKYAPIDWAAKGTRIHASLAGVREKLKKSKDPSGKRHYFLLATPETELFKVSESKTKPPKYQEVVDYSGEDSLVFQRLGLDLLQVNEDGSAAVHAEPDQFERMVASTEMMEQFSAREQVRWAKVREFDVIGAKYRVDGRWLGGFGRNDMVDVVIELQPLLLEREIGSIIEAIMAIVGGKDGGEIKGGGRDFSGRQWFRGMLVRRYIEAIARSFYSVQSMHSPQMSIAADNGRSSGRATSETQSASQQGGYFGGAQNLPCVAIMDTGVPEDHLQLAGYRRGRYTDPGSVNVRIDHGAFVASRVVFGDRQHEELESGAEGSCCFYDARIAWNNAGDIHDKSVVEAMSAIVRTAPDVRVFNFSFDSWRPLEEAFIDEKERLRTVQELDNFIFANDVVVAVAAGNSERGIQPQDAYPDHYQDARWRLGHWARSFNAVTCGSFVDAATIGAGLVRFPRWPSPFTRVGPGLCDSPKPDFSAHGGNNSVDYQHANGLGVWGFNRRGLVEDRSGTSFAVPLLAREMALAMDLLRKHCPTNTMPYGVTAKAFLALTAHPPVNELVVKKLVKVSLGKGEGQSERLRRARGNSAVFLWQGILEHNRDKARVRMPIPKAWIDEAEAPFIRLILAWDSPVNAEVDRIWACRKVEAQLRPEPEGVALKTKSRGHKSYPLVERKYDLKNLPDGVEVEGDEWLLEISYKEIAAGPSNIEISPQQRVAFAAELIDYGEAPVSPQEYVQGLPVAQTMQRLSIAPGVIRSPVIIRSRV